MASTSETGHAKNVANFQQLISFCDGYGKNYNPSRKELTLTNLQNVLGQAKAALTDVKNTKAAFDIATNSRRDTFADLTKFATRVTNTLAASGASALAVADARGIIRKMIGKRAGETKAAPAPGQDAPQAAEDKQISVAQLSFDNQIDHFSSLVTAVAQQPGYNPNEADLTVSGLQAKLDALNAANEVVIKTITGISNARLNRNVVLYHPLMGLAQLAAGVKLYVKGVFGAPSPQYKQLTGIIFHTVK